MKEAIFAYVKQTYQVEPDYPVPNAPTYPVLRHRDSRKWFALLMDVPRSKLGLPGAERVDLLNLKCAPAMAGSLRTQPGILPAYHMNKKTWTTIVLDGTVGAEELQKLLTVSRVDARADKSRIRRGDQDQQRRLPAGRCHA